MGAENQVVDVEMYGFTLNTTLQLGAGDACWLDQWTSGLDFRPLAYGDVSGFERYVRSTADLVHRDRVILECVCIHATSSQN